MDEFSVNTIPVNIMAQQTAIVIHLHEATRPSNFQAVISAAKLLLEAGHTHIVVDMTNVAQLNMTTLFTLYSLATLANKQQPASAEGGWHALHEMADKLSGQPVNNMNLCAVQPNIAQALHQGGFASVVELLPTLSQAKNAFNPPSKTAVEPAKPTAAKPLHQLPGQQTAVVP